MEFRILGPLSMDADDGRPVPVTGHRQRAVLAMLLLHAHRSVALSQLAEAVWDGEPPATARRQLQNTVSELRRQIRRAGVTRPVIVADGSGYRLLPDAGTVDSRVFADRLAAARALAGRPDVEAREDALGTFRAALALWSGAPLSGLTGRIIEAAAAGLTEQRLTAVEERLELELRQGAHPRLVGELTSLVAEHPLRERMVGQLMRALHGSGRQGEALQAYQRLRSRLADELGLDPGRTLQDLHTRILQDDQSAIAPSAVMPSAEAPSNGPMPGWARASGPVPAQLPAAITGFVGRTEELAHLDQLLPDDTESTAVVISAIAGLAGVGKTTLAVHWAHRVRERFPDGHLYVNLRGYGPGTPLTPAVAVRGFLDAFGVPPQEIPTTLDGQCGLYRSLLAGKRMLVLLDNARDAEQVRPLLPGAAGSLALVTSRDRLASLVAVEGARPVRLDVLTPAEARTILANRIGPQRVLAEPEAVDRIIAACAGLPLVLAIVAARAAIQPGFPLADLASELAGNRGLDAFADSDPAVDVRTALSWSYKGLETGSARLFRRLGQHPGPDISIAAAASVAAVPVREAHRRLQDLASAHLLAEPRPGRYTCHDLVRAYAAELAEQQDSADDRRAVTHRMLDHYLRTADRAADLVDPYRAALALPPPVPGTSPEEVTDTASALAWFAAERRVLMAVLAQPDTDDAHVPRLARTLAVYLGRAGHWHDWLAAAEAGLRAAQRHEDRQGEAFAHRGLARVYLRLGREDAALTQLQLALERYTDLGDQVGQAHTQLNLAEVYDRFGRHPMTLHHSRLALDGYRAADHLAGQAKALNSIGWSLSQQGQHQEAIRYCRDALDLQLKLADRDGAADTLDSLGHAYRHLHDHERARAHYQRAAELFHATGNRSEEGLTLEHLGDVMATMGALAAARDAWQRAASLLGPIGPAGRTEAIRAKLASADRG